MECIGSMIHLLPITNSFESRLMKRELGSSSPHLSAFFIKMLITVRAESGNQMQKRSRKPFRSVQKKPRSQFDAQLSIHIDKKVTIVISLLMILHVYHPSDIDFAALLKFLLSFLKP